MSGSTRERLARKQFDKELQGAAAHARDELHNLDSPNSMGLAEAVSDIFPEYSSTEQQEQSILGRLLRRKLQQEQAVVVKDGATTAAVSNNSSNTSATSKKKKKRKKKKKTSGKEIVEGSATATTTTSVSPPQEDVEKSSSKESEADSTLIPTTTTTSDAHGPPPAAAPPPPLSTAADAILQQWLALSPPSFDSTTTTDDYKNRDVSCFLQYITNLDSIQLNCKHVRAALDSIACEACKQVAGSYFFSRFQLDLRVDPSFMNRNDDDSTTLEVPGMEQVEHAFDYIAMEEGIMSSGENGNDETLLIFQSNDNDILTCTNHASSLCTLQPFLHTFIKNMILAHGLVESPPSSSDDDGMDVFWKEQVQVVIQNVTKEEETMRQYLDNVTTKQATILAQLEDSVIMGTHFDVKTTQNFHQYDADLEEDLQNMVKIVRKTAQRHCLSSGRTHSPHITGEIQDLSTWVVETIRLSLQQTLDHSYRLIQLSARPGAIPQMAVSAQHRSSYRDLLLHKVTHLQALRRELYTILLEKYVLRQVVSTSIMDGMTWHKTPDPEEQQSDGLDDFYAAAMVMTHTIRSGNVQNVKETIASRTQDWLKVIQTQAAAIGATDNPAYKRLLREVETYQHVVEKEEEDEDAREEALLHFSHSTFDLFRYTLEQVMYMKRTTEVYKYEGETRMPPKLVAFMQGQDAGTGRNGPCQGGGARRRVTSILLGLLYKWLQDKCNEWHAELTQHELLESMALDDDIVESKPTKTKKSKKKRDRERKNASATATTAGTRSIEASTESATNVNKAAGKEAGKANYTADSSPNTATGKSAKEPDSSAQPTVNNEASTSPPATDESANKPTVSGDAVDSNGAETSDNWSEWRADLNSTGLLDTSFTEDDLTPKRNDDDEFKVATSKKSRKKALKKGVDKKVETSTASPDVDAPEATKTTPDVSNLTSTSVSKDQVVNTSSKTEQGQKRAIPLPSTSKSTSVAKDDSAVQAKTNRGWEVRDAPKENNNRARSASIPASDSSKQKEEELKKSPSRTIPSNVLSSVDKTTSPKSKASVSPEKSAKKAESRSPQKTPNRGTKDTRPQIQAGSGKKTPYLDRSIPSQSVDVGVESATGFQSAEGFLVERLVIALKAAEGSMQ